MRFKFKGQEVLKRVRSGKEGREEGREGEREGGRGASANLTGSVTNLI